MLTPKERKYLIETIDSEGFGYTFFHYSNFPEIKDEKFHELRKNFLKSAKELADYFYYDI